MSTPPFGAVFDWDGVVIDSHDQHLASWQQLAVELDRPLAPDWFATTFGMTNRRALVEHTDWVDADDDARIRELSDRKEALYRELVRRDGIAPLDGVADLLDDLAAIDVPRALGTSTPRANVDAVLSLLDLGEPFAHIVAAEDVTLGKPDPEVFVRGAERLALPPTRCVVFEDAQVGIEAARRAGMRVVAITTTHPAEALRAADLVVDAWSELDPAVLAAWFEAPSADAVRDDDAKRR